MGVEFLLDSSFNERLDAFFETCFAKLENDLINLLFPGNKKEKEKKKQKQKQGKYWIVKKQQKIVPKSKKKKNGLKSNEEKIGPKSNEKKQRFCLKTGKTQKQTKRELKSKIKQMEANCKMQKSDQNDRFGEKKNLNSGKVMKSWLPCDVIRLKEFYILD